MLKKYNYTFISILFAYTLTLTLILLYFLKLQDYISIPVCPFYTYLGWYCPACGGTRAVISLLKFDLISSFLFNPIVIYAIFFTSLYLITEFINITFYKKINIPFKLIFKIGILILVINWIIKNIFIIYNKF